MVTIELLLTGLLINAATMQLLPNMIEKCRTFQVDIYEFFNRQMFARTASKVNCLEKQEEMGHNMLANRMPGASRLLLNGLAVRSSG